MELNAFYEVDILQLVGDHAHYIENELSQFDEKPFPDLQHDLQHGFRRLHDSTSDR